MHGPGLGPVPDPGWQPYSWAQAQARVHDGWAHQWNGNGLRMARRFPKMESGWNIDPVLDSISSITKDPIRSNVANASFNFDLRIFFRFGTHLINCGPDHAQPYLILIK